MSIKAAAFAAFIASSAANIEQQGANQPWEVQEDEVAVVVRAYHKDSQTHFMLGCTAGSPVSMVVHRADGKEGWHINLKVDDGDSIQYSGSLDDVPGIAFNQVNTELPQWHRLMEALRDGKTLKVLTNFSNGATLARYPLDGFGVKLKEWYDVCDKRGWMF